MSPIRKFTTDEGKIVVLVQKFRPSYFREYLMWTHVWRNDPENGRGPLLSPVGKSLLQGRDIFWDILDSEMARVQCYHTAEVRARLESKLEEEE